MNSKSVQIYPRLKKLQRLQNKLNHQINLSSTYRIYFSLLALTGVGLISVVPSRLHLFVFVTGVTLFLFAVKQGRRAKILRRLTKKSIGFYQRQLEKSQGKTPPQSFYPSKLSKTDSIRAGDLDLVGEHSIFNFLDECFSYQGQKKLWSWMVQNPTPYKDTIDRQHIIKKLSPYWNRFLKFVLLGLNQEVKNKEITSQLASSLLTPYFHLFFKLHLLLSPLMWLLIILSVNNVIPIHPIIVFLSYLFFSILTAKHVEHSFSSAQSLSLALESLQPQLKLIHQRLAFNELKNHLPHIYKKEVTQFLKATSRLTSLLSLRGHPMAQITLNMLLPYEFIATWMLEKQRLKHSQLMNQLIEELAQLEALSSLIFVYKFHSPHLACVKEIELKKNKAPLTQLNSESIPSAPEKEFYIKASNMRHPLIPNGTPNDLLLKNDQIITGSNMSGKSTFLRTLGINQTLALMGAPVFASEFITFSIPLYTCIRINDSVFEKISSFYYEVQQISFLLKQAQIQPIIYLIDEIFRGTNNRERLIGAKGVILELAQNPLVIGLVTTHDLELTELSKDLKGLKNQHFVDGLKDKKMYFDYILREGPCPTTNAIEIMKAQGIKV